MIRTLQTKTESLVFLDLQGRVAKLLLELLADRSVDGKSLDLNMTQGELASMVGGSRPSVNQVLKTLESRGYITTDGKQVVINDVDSLRRLSTT
jgi:CRP-like cAMP-binding protein